VKKNYFEHRTMDNWGMCYLVSINLFVFGMYLMIFLDA